MLRDVSSASCPGGVACSDDRDVCSGTGLSIDVCTGIARAFLAVIANLPKYPVPAVKYIYE
jgi:hypothetical protein